MDDMKKEVSKAEEKVKQVSKKVGDTALKARETVKKTADETVTKAKKTADETVTKAKKTADETIKKAKAAVRKSPVRKTVAKKAAAVKKAVLPKVTSEVVLQYYGRELSLSELVARAKAIYLEDGTHKEADLKDIRVYVKPEDNAAYYVINGDATGSFEL